MVSKTTPEELWARQQISCLDVDYDAWDRKRDSIREFSRMSSGCMFTVDVFKKRYDFASDNFSALFGYAPAVIETVREQGDFLEERIHPDDRIQITEYQIEHGQFIYSLPPEERNDYRQVFQWRMLNAKGRYVQVTSRQQVLEKDRNGKAWIIMGMLDISPDQTPSDKVRRTVIHRKTGMIIPPALTSPPKPLTVREKEILTLISRGFLSKEIADKLGLSIYTVNNHRKNIWTKLEVDNAVEAINTAREYGIIC